MLIFETYPEIGIALSEVDIPQYFSNAKWAI
jgi:hypothetical protein